VISRLQSALLGAFGRRPTLAPGPVGPDAGARRSSDRMRRAAPGEADTRIEAARRRLKATIPPPPD
jgi:hypothetical protein